MRLYTVHAPPDETPPPERFLFVKDGFSWPALLLPPLWILWHRLWVTAVFFVVFVLVVAWTGRLANEDAAATVAILGAILFALEANNIRRLSLEGRGWGEVGAASGGNIDEAEVRFFTDWRERPKMAVQQQPMVSPARPSDARERGGDQPILGLFPEAER